MPFPIAAVVGSAARVALPAVARGVATTARFGIRGAKGAAKMSGRAAMLGGSISSSQFSGVNTNPTPGTAVTESLRFGADMRVGTEK